VGVRFFSICTGAFLLADASLLDGRECTTHWAYVETLQRRHPAARVLANRLFVASGRVTTSAGIVAGVDMTLDLLEQEHGPLLAAKVARDMVVYIRRDGSHSQRSVYLDYRGHLHQGIHELQDWLVAHPQADLPLAEFQEADAGLDQGVDPVGGEDLQGGVAGGNGQGMRVDAHEHGSGDVLFAAVFHQGLGHRQDVVFVECRVERASGVTRGSEAHLLLGHVRIRLAGVVGRDQGGQIDQRILGGRFSGQRVDGHGAPFGTRIKFEE